MWRKKCYREGELDTVDPTQYFDAIKESYRIADPNVQVYTSDYFNSLSCFTNMLYNGNYIYVSTHGTGGKLATYDQDGYLNGSISPTDFNRYGANTFSNVELCVLLACESAKGQENIAKTLYQKGVKCVIGFSQSIAVGMSEEWQRYFADAHAFGWTVANAIRYADKKVYTLIDEQNPDSGYNWGFMNKHVVYGDSSIRFEEDE